MIVIWYRHRGQLPSKSSLIREDANKASVLPSSFEIVGVSYGRQLDDGFDANQFAIRCEPPSDKISTDAVDAIATAFSDNWGGAIEHVETVVQ
jgi:hypothetical protein